MVVDKTGSKTGHWHDTVDAVVEDAIYLDKDGLTDTPDVLYCI